MECEVLRGVTTCDVIGSQLRIGSIVPDLVSCIPPLVPVGRGDHHKEKEEGEAEEDMEEEKRLNTEAMVTQNIVYHRQVIQRY